MCAILIDQQCPHEALAFHGLAGRGDRGTGRRAQKGVAEDDGETIDPGLARCLGLFGVHERQRPCERADVRQRGRVDARQRGDDLGGISGMPALRMPRRTA